MTYLARDDFEVDADTTWLLTLRRPIMEGIPSVSMYDRLGSNVGIKVVASKDSRILTVVSESGLRLAGTISVLYKTTMHSVKTVRNPSPDRASVRRSA